ncbi:ribokinase [Vallitalea guaymasensis]|uniref:Ribokinase n=1 Tax=Vallitalea guaymasensis TaxID=1185412 RepID=A0A8J8MCE6_9FIRM|nr:ribokinase [Vallitalea guaymasensis]QUH30110.1 ribokinase [Vallitalea guaymasensis]
MKIVVVGSTNMDYVLKTNELPKLGETLSAMSFNTVFGGKGANQAVAAARLGAEVTMIAAVGDDSIGEQLKDNLAKESINVEGVNVVEGPSGVAMITVADNGDNTIVVYPGANGKIDEKWLEANEALIMSADCILVQLEIPINVVMKAVKIASDNNVKVIFNPAPAKEFPNDIFKYVDIITPNETELKKISGKEDIKEGAMELIERGANSVVVTLGEQGSMYIDKDNTISAGSFTVKSIDSTAAGDAFNAALGIKLIESDDIEDGLKYSNAVGALVTTKLGAQTSLPFKNEVEAFMKNK